MWPYVLFLQQKNTQCPVSEFKVVYLVNYFLITVIKGFLTLFIIYKTSCGLNILWLLLPIFQIFFSNIGANIDFENKHSFCHLSLIFFLPIKSELRNKSSLRLRIVLAILTNTLLSRVVRCRPKKVKMAPRYCYNYNNFW